VVGPPAPPVTPPSLPAAHPVHPPRTRITGGSGSGTAGHRRPLDHGHRLTGAAAGAGLLAACGAAAWLALAAAQRPSVLSPPTIRAPHRWLLGPLSGVLPHLSADPVRLHADLTIALAVMLGGWLVAWAAAPGLPVRVVAAAVGAAQVVMVLGPPQPLTDAFNYIVYGRMAAHGLNPYTQLPLQGPHDTAYVLANWHHLPSPYGPLFTLLSEPLGLMSLPVAFWVWKVVVLASALGLLALVWWLAVRVGRSPQRALACVGLCPVTLAVGTGGLHNDGPAMLCVVAAVACVLRARDDGERHGGGWDAAAGALAVVAAGLKPSFAVAAPLIVLGVRHRPWAIAGAAWAAAAVVGIVVLAFGGALPAIGLQGRIATPVSVPSLLGHLFGHGGADGAVRAWGRDALFVVVAAACAAVAWRRRWMLPALGLVLLAAVLSLSWVMPWYLAWSLPFVAIRAPRVLVPAAVATCLWLGVGGIPQLPTLLHDVGLHPTRTATGLANHDLEVQLVR
jgi:hypothetical protein